MWYWLIGRCVLGWKYKKVPRAHRELTTHETSRNAAGKVATSLQSDTHVPPLLLRSWEYGAVDTWPLPRRESPHWPPCLKTAPKRKTFQWKSVAAAAPLLQIILDRDDRCRRWFSGFYRTCRFSQLFDLLSRAQTLSSKLRTFRLVLVRLPRYFLGELFSEHEPSGDLLRFFRDLFRNISLVRSGFSSFRRICVRRPTSNSSTLWLIPTDVSMNLQS